MDYVPILRRMLALKDRYLDAQSRILDFGCGAGTAVYRFRDAGFDARGFDIHDYLDLRSPGDRQYFEIADNGNDKSTMTLDWGKYRLPYADSTFDFVMSFTVLEHVLDLDAVLAEIARITKPSGIGIHVFPSKYRPIEGHTYVPFGGMTKSYLYYLFWAKLGIRNEFQQGLSAADTAKKNVRYANTGTCYHGIRQLRAIGERHFQGVRFGHDIWQIAWRNYGRYNWRLTRPALLAYTLFNQSVWILECPIRREPLTAQQRPVVSHQNTPEALKT